MEQRSLLLLLLEKVLILRQHVYSHALDAFEAEAPILLLLLLDLPAVEPKEQVRVVYNLPHRANHLKQIVLIGRDFILLLTLSL